MRGCWIVAVLVACHHADAPAPVAPKGPTPCARASDSMVQTMLDQLPEKAELPMEQADAIRNLIRERCEQDGWSAEATRCLIAMKRQDDAEACAKLLTDDQQAALVRDQEARFGAKAGGEAAPSAPSPPSAHTVPGGAGRAIAAALSVSPADRAKAGKSKGNGAAGDLRRGGE